jgi:hypothetical protein
MQRFAHITNETEFQEWLALVLQAERTRLQEQTVGHDSAVPVTLKLDQQSEEHHESTREK